MRNLREIHIFYLKIVLNINASYIDYIILYKENTLVSFFSNNILEGKIIISFRLIFFKFYNNQFKFKKF